MVAQALNEQPTVSVIIPLFNAKPFIARALQSVIAQTYPVEEIIVVDDGSTDEPWEELEPFKDRITLIRTQNSGSGRARNIGANRSRGTLLAFLDADDEWRADKLALQVKKLLDADAALVYCGRTHIDEASRYVSDFAQHEFPQGFILRELLRENHISTSSAVLLRRDVFGQLGGFSGNQALKVSEDFELWCRIAAKFHIAAVPEPLVRYRLHGSNTSSNQWDCYRGKVQALGQLRQYLLREGRLDAVLESELREKILDTHLAYAWGFAQNSDYLNSKRAIRGFLLSGGKELPLLLRLTLRLPVALIGPLHGLRSLTKKVVSKK